MRRIVFGMVAVIGVSMVSAPEAAGQESGWWRWALPAIGELRYDDRHHRDRDNWYDRDRDDRYDRDRRDRDDEWDERYRDGDRYDRRRGRDDRRRYDRRSGGSVDIYLGRRGGDRVYRRDRDRRRGRGPAFCRSGRGHPVHGRRWCREKGWGSYDRGPVVWHRHDRWDRVVLRSPRIGYRHGAILDQRDLIYILGEVIFRGLAREAHLAHTDRVRGRWLSPDGRAGVLQIRSGLDPVAELTDLNGDGRVDAVLLPRR